MTNAARLKDAIIAAREALEEVDADAAWERFAEKLADAFILEIKAAQITYNGGLTVTGSTVNGIFNNTIS